MARSIKPAADPLDDHESSSPDGYEQVYAGKPFYQPEGRQWGLACCHCGLVHSVRIDHDGVYVDKDVDGGMLKITMKENAAATKRHRKVPGEAPALDEAYQRGYRDALRRVEWQRKLMRRTNKKAAP